jgi:hypothetical protein
LPGVFVVVSDRERRAIMLIIWVAIAAGSGAVVELLYLAARWALG